MSPPPSSVSPSVLRHLKFAYISALLIIVFLLCSAQLLIQLSLQEETQTRAYALMIGTQALRTQALEQEALNLTDKTQDIGENLLTLQATERVWERTHQQIMALSLSSDERAKLQAIQPFFLAMQSGYRSILALEGTHPRLPTDMSATDKATFITAFKAIFYSTPSDLRGLVYITQSLNFEADTYVSDIRLIEIALFLLSLLTLGAEWLFVIRPATRHLENDLSSPVPSLPTPASPTTT